MGGLTFIVYTDNTNINIDYINAFMNTKHRGVDDSNIVRLSTDNLNNLSNIQMQTINLRLSKDEIRRYKQYHFLLGYHRMSINDSTFNATQPFEDPIMNKLLKYPELRSRPNRRLMCNGEIYNYNELISVEEFSDGDLSSSCDVEVILPLYIKYGITDTLEKLNGEFSFVITENINTFELDRVNAFVCRDYLGIKPLYYVTNVDNSLFLFVSEIKSLPLYIIQNLSYRIEHVLPGSYWTFHEKQFVSYYSLDKFKEIESCVISSTQADSLVTMYNEIQERIMKSIRLRSNGNHAQGVLLSGGFDSCLVASLLVKQLYDNKHDFVNDPVHIFTVGDALGDDSIDCNYAIRFVCFLEEKYGINLHHHIINVNTIEVLASDLDEIIYYLESYDPETVRESIPMYYLMKYISEKTDVRVLLSGDGLDELAGGYSVFTELVDSEFQLKSVNLLQNMFKYDLLRIDRMSNRFSLEIRCPFLDKSFVEYMLTLHPRLKRPGFYSPTELPVEKYIVRKSFEKGVFNEIIMPDEQLWKPHSCMCSTLTNFELRLTNYINSELLNDDLYNILLNTLLHENNNNNMTLPKNKEEMYYRLLFRKHYPNRDNIINSFWG